MEKRSKNELLIGTLDNLIRIGKELQRNREELVNTLGLDGPVFVTPLASYTPGAKARFQMTRLNEIADCLGTKCEVTTWDNRKYVEITLTYKGYEFFEVLTREELERLERNKEVAV